MACTPFEGTQKDLSTWGKFAECMIDGLTLEQSAKKCKIHRNTAFVWRHKIIDALRQSHEKIEKLKGIVEFDDTFLPLSFKGGRLPEGRKVRRRSTPSSKRGISKDKVCISCAVSRNGGLYSRVTTLGRPTAEILDDVFGDRLSKKCTLCSDRDTAYKKFAKANGFKLKRVKRASDSRGANGKYHVQNVNSDHSHLKGFLKPFRGVSTKHLQSYVVWFNIIKRQHKSRNALLRLCLKGAGSRYWREISDGRPAPGM